ncbi:type II toxin-antitoxin system VapC family toxin [Corynebacterium sp. CCUG 70398]|uniref:type II toxin-antitoxin system VapC family toxin n=1 Tax=Corynebacterium sp. CCUG 70398 TaxID=2823891 RepID=UPI000F90FEC5|nr:type II toxin-antitoxin system VapC family toxin [Corynebacterium sp. CCUG 70398]MCQ4623297.1 type II toxin-antitoxin system VapC family toxin [Corynebacterium sp. CCUG 70398]VDG64216.1 Ribonuclease VapC1 [Streptococcus thermophilus]
MRYLFDTNVWIDLERGSYPHVLDRASSCTRDQVGVSTVVLGELYAGALRSMDPIRARRSIDTFLAGWPRIGVDERTAEIYAEIRAALQSQGRVIGPNDLWIAAQALREDVVLVTANDDEFSRVPSLEVENWR